MHFKPSLIDMSILEAPSSQSVPDEIDSLLVLGRRAVSPAIALEPHANPAVARANKEPGHAPSAGGFTKGFPVRASRFAATTVNGICVRAGPFASQQHAIHR